MARVIVVLVSTYLFGMSGLLIGRLSMHTELQTLQRTSGIAESDYFLRYVAAPIIGAVAGWFIAGCD